jgi:hypothetical protein
MELKEKAGCQFATSRILPEAIAYGFWMKKEGYAESAIER